MASTYTSNIKIEKPGNGDQTGTWGETVNSNMDIIDRLTSQVGSISLSGVSTYTLETTDTVSEGHYSLIQFTGTPDGTCTVTISPNNIQRIYTIYNATNQTVVMAQGSGSTVNIPATEVALIYSDGAGSGASITRLSYTVEVTDPNPDALTNSDIGSTVQGYDADLTALGSLAKADGNFIVGNGTTWVVESGSTALASLGITASASSINNSLTGVTWTLSDLNTLTATAAELNILDGATVTTAEINQLDGISSAGGTLIRASTTTAQRSALGLGALATLNTVDTAQIASGERMTTTNVNTSIASSSVGAVGTYAMLGAQGSLVYPGSTASGSSLAYGGTGADDFESNDFLAQLFGNPSGTWRCMGLLFGSSGNLPVVTLFLRIS